MTTPLAQNVFVSNSSASDAADEKAAVTTSQPPATATIDPSREPLAADCIAELLGYASDKPSRFVLDEDALFEAIEPLPLFLRDAG